MNIDYMKLRFYRRFQKRFFSHKTKIWGYVVFYNDPRSLYSEFKNIFLNKIYHFESESKNPLIIDGGGHIGLATFYFKKIYPDSRIIIFEPDIQSLKLLKKNLETNKIKETTVWPIGLSNRRAEAEIENSGTDGAKVGTAQNGKNIIRLDKLSNYLDRETDFLKLNIEGEETAVLKDLAESGKISLIKKMCLEWHSFAGQPQNLGELLIILEKNNFKYLINHFDYKINPRLKPPFKAADKIQYYLLVYAERKDL